MPAVKVKESQEGFTASFILPSGKKVIGPLKSSSAAAVESAFEVGLSEVGLPVSRAPTAPVDQKTSLPQSDPAVLVVAAPPPSALPPPSFTSPVQLLPGLTLENSVRSPARPQTQATARTQQFPSFSHPPPPFPMNFCQPPPSVGNQHPTATPSNCFGLIL